MEEKEKVGGVAAKLSRLYAFYAETCAGMAARIVEYGSKGMDLSRRYWPDCVLDPDVNEISAYLELEGLLLKSLGPGELPAEVVESAKIYLAAEDRLVELLERKFPDECWSETRSADHALWAYMSVVPNRDGSLIDRMVERKRAAYQANKKAAYRHLMAEISGGAASVGSRAERRLERIEGTVAAIARPANRFFWHDWPNKKRVKMRELEAVLAYVQANDDVGPELLHDACKTVYADKRMDRLVEYGGYPNANALYQICHAHVAEFFRGK